MGVVVPEIRLVSVEGGKGEVVPGVDSGISVSVGLITVLLSVTCSISVGLALGLLSVACSFSGVGVTGEGVVVT